MKALITGASSGIGRDMAKLQSLIEQLEKIYEPVEDEEKTSIIKKSELSENILTSIQTLLEVDKVSPSISEESLVDITIILGKDFNK